MQSWSFFAGTKLQRTEKVLWVWITAPVSEDFSYSARCRGHSLLGFFSESTVPSMESTAKSSFFMVPKQEPVALI